MLTMLHCVEQLVFVNELTDNEVRQADQKNLPRISQNTVDKTDDEYKYRLRQEETVAEDRRLYEFCII